jgi:hypothetical protein
MPVMLENFRSFEAGPDPFGRIWQARFLWQQNAISIRHADTVDVKFAVAGGGREGKKIIALEQTHLARLAAELGRPLTDAWASRLAAAHLKQMIESDQDMEKTLVTPSYEQLREYARSG